MIRIKKITNLNFVKMRKNIHMKKESDGTKTIRTLS